MQWTGQTPLISCQSFKYETLDQTLAWMVEWWFRVENMKMWMQRIEKIEKIGKDNLHSKDLLSKLTLTMLSNQTLVRELVYLSKHGGLDTI